jgi:hypothetical protein
MRGERGREEGNDYIYRCWNTPASGIPTIGDTSSRVGKTELTHGNRLQFNHTCSQAAMMLSPWPPHKGGQSMVRTSQNDTMNP